MGKFRKKPVVIEAFQMTEETWMNTTEWPQWLIKANSEKAGRVGDLYLDFTLDDTLNGRMFIHTLEGLMEVSLNDWIIQGVHSELYPVKPDIFLETYEKIED